MQAERWAPNSRGISCDIHMEAVLLAEPGGLQLDISVNKLDFLLKGDDVASAGFGHEAQHVAKPGDYEEQLVSLPHPGQSGQHVQAVEQKVRGQLQLQGR